MKNENKKINNSFNEYAQWLKRKSFNKETIEKYLRNLNKFGNKELSTNFIVDFLHKNLEKYHPGTLRGQRNTLASYARFLKIHDKIEWDIVNKIIPRIQKKPFSIVTYEEFELLKATKTSTDKKTNERNNIILDFLFYIGMRITELINIKHSDYCNGLLGINGKGNKLRYVLLPNFLVSYFDPCSSNYLFLTRNGKKLTKENIGRNMKRKAKKAGIKKNISPHSFRRSFATNSYNLGVRLDTIQKQLGHSNLNTTLDYIHNDYQALYQDYSKLWKTNAIGS